VGEKKKNKEKPLTSDKKIIDKKNVSSVTERKRNPVTIPA